MTKFKYGLYLALSLTIIAVNSKAYAYDEDTHFYGTYAMARFAGIRHEVAAKLATTAQWMDESYVSDPTSMIVLPITGVRKRRLLHFPSSREVGKVAAEIQDESFGFSGFEGLEKAVVSQLISIFGYKGQLDHLAFHTQTEPDHEMASALLMEGLREGNLMKCGASLHTLEDSFAHAGTSAEAGHTTLWHWPDRPSTSTDKYFQMTTVLFKALVAIRDQLPEEAKDCNYRVIEEHPNCELGPEVLARVYNTTPEVVHTVSRDILKDKEYIRAALTDFIVKAERANYLDASGFRDGQTFAKVLDQVLSPETFMPYKMDAYDVLEMFVNRLVEMQGGTKGGLLNLKLIPYDMGLMTEGAGISVDDFIGTYKQIGPVDAKVADAVGMKGFLRLFAYHVLASYVPLPINDYHHVEIEDDSAISRKTEMEMRVAGMRRLIMTLFHTNIQFVGNNTKDDIGFGQEIDLNPLAETTLPPKKSHLNYATFNLKEKNKFDRMIFKYLFPSLSIEEKDDELKKIVWAVRSMRLASVKNISAIEAKKREELAKENMTWTQKLWYGRYFDKFESYDRELTSYIVAPAVVARFVAQLRPYMGRFFSDLVNTRIKPMGYERLYNDAEKFRAYKQARERLGQFPTLMSPKDVWNISDLIAQGSL